MAADVNESAAPVLRRDSLGVVNLLLAKVLRAPLWLILSALMARVLGPEGLGTWSMILAAAMLLNQLLLQWTQSITQRFGRQEWLFTQQLDSNFAVRRVLLAGSFAVACALLLFAPFDWLQRFYGLGGGLRWYVLFVMLTLWLMAEAQSLQQMRERFVLLAWSPLLSDLFLLCVIGPLALASMSAGALSRDTVFICLYASSFCIWLFWCANEMRSLRQRWLWPERAALKRAFLFALPLLPGFLIGYLAEWGDYFLIRHFYGEQGVGLFHPAYQYLLILAGLPAALASVLLPRIVAKHDHDGGAALRHLLLRNAPQFTLLWGVAVMVMAALMPTLLALLLGPSYAGSVSVLQILLIAVPGAVVQHVCGVACFVQGRLGISITGFFGLKSLLNLSLSFLLLPLLGLTGSAIGASASYVLLQWLFVLDQQRLLKIGGTGAGTLVQALLLVQLGGLLLVGVNGLWPRLVLAALGVSVLLAWTRHAGLFSRDEVSAIIPPRWQWLEKPLQRLLCRTA